MRMTNIGTMVKNLMLSTALQAVEKQKEFTGAAAEEFARVFTTQTLRTDSSSPHLGPFSSPLSGEAPGLSKSRSPPRDTGLNSPIHVVSSDSDSEVEDISFDLAPKLPSPTPRQSGRTRKPTKKLESQKRREIENQSKPKRQKVRKSKIDVTSQLKEYLGSDIELIYVKMQADM